MSLEIKDVTGEPRPTRDIEAALRWVEAEMVQNPTRMGPGMTGPAIMHLMVVRDVLRDTLHERSR
jgi:hypothetical protein